jgi:hypothetical protein
MSAETFAVAGGVYCLGFAVFHLTFWKLFRWGEDLRSLTFVNRAVYQILNLCLTFVFVVFAIPSLALPGEMVGTDLGRMLLMLIAVFWLLRAGEQVWFFGLRNRVSIAFFALFLAGSALYAVPLVMPAQ